MVGVSSFSDLWLFRDMATSGNQRALPMRDDDTGIMLVVLSGTESLIANGNNGALNIACGDRVSMAATQMRYYNWSMGSVDRRSRLRGFQTTMSVPSRRKAPVYGNFRS
jgi:hypothetical protein